MKNREQVLRLVQHFIIIPFLGMGRGFFCVHITTGLTLSQSIFCCFLGNIAYVTIVGGVEKDRWVRGSMDVKSRERDRETITETERDFPSLSREFDWCS